MSSNVYLDSHLEVDPDGALQMIVESVICESQHDAVPARKTGGGGQTTAAVIGNYCAWASTQEVAVDLLLHILKMKYFAT